MALHVGREAAVDNENTSKSFSDEIPVAMMEATMNLTTHLSQSESFLRLKAAQNKLNADVATLQLLEEFINLQQKIHADRAAGHFSDTDIQRFRDLQEQVATNDIVQERDYALEKAVGFVREVNQEISSLLGVDFASLTRRSTGGC